MALDWDGADADKNRSLIAMRRAGKTCAEIASELGISRNAVVGRMHRLQKSDRLDAYGRPGRAPNLKPDWAALSRDERKDLISEWQGQGLPVRACVLKVRSASESAIRTAAASLGMPFPGGCRVRGRDHGADLCACRAARS